MFLWVVIMDKSDYIQKLKDMVEEGISKGTYKRNDDTTRLQKISRFSIQKLLQLWKLPQDVSS